jgi:lipopolysaccharide transport system ATP-binding protein
MSSEHTTPDSTEYAIEVNGLSKCYQIYDKPSDRLKQMLMRGRKQYYKEFWALKDVSFKIKKGETVGIIGRNGSGKSTLLQMICGTLNPTAGEMKVNGRVAALLELGAGFNPEFTGVENIYMAATLYGLTRIEVDERLNNIRNFADIGEHIFQPVKTYSSGMYVRLAFAVVAHVNADILVIDEALAVGDAVFTQKCMRFLREFKKNGTILFVSHDISALSALCDSACWLNKGELISYGSPKVVSDQYLEFVYEQQQGESLNQVKSAPPLNKENPIDQVEDFIDMRMNYINESNLRNDIEIFRFNEKSNSFGLSGAKIYDVYLRNYKGDKVNWIVGGEIVSLRILIKAISNLKSIIVGFSVKDKTGQIVFGDNTFVRYYENPINLNIGSEIEAIFEFRMPILPAGEYSINTAIAEGSQTEHVQHHMIHDALIFRSVTTSVANGLVGIPMKNVEIKFNDEA